MDTFGREIQRKRALFTLHSWLWNRYSASVVVDVPCCVCVKTTRNKQFRLIHDDTCRCCFLSSARFTVAPAPNSKHYGSQVFLSFSLSKTFTSCHPLARHFLPPTHLSLHFFFFPRLPFESTTIDKSRVCLSFFSSLLSFPQTLVSFLFQQRKSSNTHTHIDVCVCASLKCLFLVPMADYGFYFCNS